MDDKKALNDIGVEGRIVYRVEGCGAQAGYVAYYCGVKRDVHILP